MPFEYVRTTSGEYKCPHCDFVKKNQSTVHMHIKAKHSGTFKHKCDCCEYETTTKQNLENHILSKHPEKSDKDKKEYKCEFNCNGNCTFTTSTKGGLRSHYMLKHLMTEVKRLLEQKEKEYCCSSCKTEFKSKPAAIYHMPKCLNEKVLEDLSKNVKDILGI